MIDREWVSIIDPGAPAERYLFDVTFLLSRYRCIYGRGCPSTAATPSPDLGCCSFGAHSLEPADRARVEAAARRLDPAVFMHHEEARRGGVSVELPGGQARTRIVDGACIFLNRESWPGGAGCALHRAAIVRGAHPITSFDRGAWGEGGADFGWWCTEAPEAYTADTPLYQTMAAELVAMTSPAVYAELADHLSRRRPAPRRLPVVRVC